MNEQQLEFKKETGLNAVKEVQIHKLIEPYDEYIFHEMSKKEILSCIKYDCEKNLFEVILTSDTDFVEDAESLCVYRKQYVEYLENKLQNIKP